MSKRGRKTPKFSHAPKVSKKPTIVKPFPEDVIGDGKVHFRFRYFDKKFQLRDEASTATSDCFYTIGDKLKSYARMGWGHIEADKHHNHPVALNKLCTEAQKRLAELTFDDLDSLFRLRFTSKQRLWGVRSKDVFYVLWWDPHHKVCPSSSR